MLKKKFSILKKKHGKKGQAAILIALMLMTFVQMSMFAIDTDDTEAFQWATRTGLVTLPRPGGVASAAASDINDAGVGSCVGADA